MAKLSGAMILLALLVAGVAAKPSVMESGTFSFHALRFHDCLLALLLKN